MKPEQGSVRFGGTTIQYHVRRSARRRKTVDITVDGTGVQVAVPQDTPDEDVRDIVRRRAPWILAHAPETLLEALPKGFVSGETLPYLGRNVRMVVSVGDVRAPEVRFDHWRLRITVPRGLPGERPPGAHRQGHRVLVPPTGGGPSRHDRRPVVVAVRRRRTLPAAHQEPAPTMGELRPRRDAPLQLEAGDAETRSRGVRGGA